ncbi:MAG: DUF1501 domain-containing protein [Verrucomicrobia bacterium]|nr:DUF1501 domain-containing protein [Verrucomicrobiota bacterium]
MKPVAIQSPFQLQDALNRRLFLRRTATSAGMLALSSLLNPAVAVPTSGSDERAFAFPARAKRIIYLHQSGAPSHLDLFDHKPGLEQWRGKDLPASVRSGQRLTGMTSGYTNHAVFPSPFAFKRHGEGGLWLSELWPHLSRVADDLFLIKTLNTEAINHDPAITFVHTGSQIAGRPSFGSWLAYGLGSENSDLPAFIVMTSDGTGRPGDQPLYDRLWSAGFLPSRYQGVRFRAQGDPVLFLSDPPGVNRESRRAFLDGVGALNQQHNRAVGDPEIQTRISQYEMAFRMQASVPELTDLSGESPALLEMYGPEVKKPGTFAANCLLARRLAERNVRFIQLYHRGWDQHFNLRDQIKGQAYDVDQPCYALLTDLKQRGLLADTLVVWAGEFGRTVYGQGDINSPKIGRDHHPKCFSGWVAGAGIRGGRSYGETDDFGYNIVADPVSFFDLNATLLRLLGIDHTRLTFKHQGRDYRLTDVHGRALDELIS